MTSTSTELQFLAGLQAVWKVATPTYLICPSFVTVQRLNLNESNLDKWQANALFTSS